MTPDDVRRSAETPDRAVEADLPGVAKDLSDAFSTDPHFDWFLRNDAGRDAARAAMFRHMIGVMAWPDARIDRPKEGGAAAVWMPFEWLKPPTLMEELRGAPVMLRATGLGRIRRLMAIRAGMNRHHPMKQRHAYLWFLGVTPQLQGMGIGSRLLRAGTDRLDAEGLPAYLETGTTRNVALYRRHGFEVIHEAPPAPGAPVMWHMWRDPA
ncbi:MAG TPA: GNAT family N-acetyltransferase [Caulobacteraceae bacterium]